MSSISISRRVLSNRLYANTAQIHSNLHVNASYSSLSIFSSSSSPSTSRSPSPFVSPSTCLSPSPLFLIPSRGMANKEQKNKDKANMKKKKEKLSGSKDLVRGEETGLPEVAIRKIEEFEMKSEELIDRYRGEIGELMIGRVSTQMFDNTQIKIFGEAAGAGAGAGSGQKGGNKDNKSKSESKVLPLLELCAVSARDAHTLILSVFDEQFVLDVKKSLEASNRSEIDVSLEGTGNLIVTLPKATKEGKNSFIREIQKKADNTKTLIRAQRQNYLQSIKSAKLSEDQMNNYKSAIQHILDSSNNKIDTLNKQKQQEINKA